MKASAPASTANIGPGFDCLGAALSVSLTLEVGDGEPFPKRIQKAISAVAKDAGEVTGTITSDIPVARGLGSSAACVAAGLLIGCSLAGEQIDPEELLWRGTPIEGHPDNLAPALLGGVVLVTPGRVVQRFAPTDEIRPVILVPSFSLSTVEARKALIDHTLGVKEAAQNVAWLTGLVAMLNAAAPVTREALLECTNDHIHQPPRREVLHASMAVVDELRDRGVAAAISGAGPSVVCLLLRGDPDPQEPEGWTILDAGWSAEGARIL